mmetsp:Transcript_97697/g.252848  ORF Transcript_97697/g.252848 Transcript_97697/m.252848 type:complete len:237 (-) Transcript_97697:43-753(-)
MVAPTTRPAQASTSTLLRPPPRTRREDTSVDIERQKSAATCMKAVHMLMPLPSLLALLLRQKASMAVQSNRMPQSAKPMTMYGFTSSSLGSRLMPLSIASCMSSAVNSSSVPSEMPVPRSSDSRCQGLPTCFSTMQLRTRVPTSTAMETLSIASARELDAIAPRICADVMVENRSTVNFSTRLLPKLGLGFSASTTSPDTSRRMNSAISSAGSRLASLSRLSCSAVTSMEHGGMGL